MKKVILVTLIALGALAAGAQMKIKSLGFVAPSLSDRTTVYQPQKGEIVFDTTSSGFFGNVGTPTSPSWQDLGSASNIVPVGAVTMFAGSSAPAGWMILDGSSLDRTTYAALFAVIGTTYGAVDGSHFSLPDARGIFVRGAGTNSLLSKANGGTFSASLGAMQNDQIQGHVHRVYPTNTQNVGFAGGTGSTLFAPMEPGGLDNYVPQGPTTDGTNGTPRSGSETRPASVVLNYIIKVQ